MPFSSNFNKKIKPGGLSPLLKIRASRAVFSLLIALIAAIGTHVIVRAAPTILATMTAAFVGVHDGDGKADPGETIEYTAVIQNSGADPATGITFDDVLDLNTTLVAGSLNVSPLAVDDSYSTIGNTLLDVGIGLPDPAVHVTTGSIDSLFDNDTEFLGDTFTLLSVQADTTSPFTTATEQGGSVTVEADGNFSYTPPADFTGADHFDYIITDDGAVGSGALTGAGRVTINVTQMVWYVKNDATAGGLGRSTDPFDTLAEAQTASAANETIYIFQGDGTTTDQNAGINLKSGQRLIGEGVALTVPVSVNGGANPTTLRAAGSQPQIDNTSGNGVSVTNISNVEIRGLNIAGSDSAVDVTTSGANSGSFELANNTIRSSGTDGVDVNGGGSGTLTVNLHDNTVTSTGNGIDIQRTAGNVTIIAFDDNVVMGNTAGTGINIAGTGATILFDANPGTAAFDMVLGGTTVVGQSGNGVGTSGLVMNNIRGDLSFTDLDVYSDGGVALYINGTTPNFLVSGTGTRVTANTNTPTLSATGGPALDAQQANINLALTSLTSTNSPTTGVSLSTTGGIFSAPSGSTITNANGTDFFINGNSNSNANVGITYGGTITDDLGTLIQIQNATAASTHSFTGAITDNNDGDGSGISLTNNTGATITFSGGMTLSTGSNAAFSATSGGTVNVTGSTNTLTTSTGTALNVQNTTIGASGLTFRSISSNGASSGIVLNNTGSGGLTVTGNTSGNCGGNVSNNGATVTAPVSGDCSGGTILSSTSTGILLTSASNISLTRMRIANSADDGIGGTSVSGFTLTSSLVENNGNAVGDRGIDLTNLTGSGGIATSTIRSSKEHNIVIANTSGNLTAFNVTNSQIATNDLTPGTGTGDDGIQILNNGTSSMAISVTQSAFTDNKGDHFQAASSASATGSIAAVFSNNTLKTTAANDPQVVGGGITINPGNAADITFTISNNNIQQAFDDAININHDPSSTAAGNLEGTISNNIIGTSGDPDSGSESSNAITVAAKGAGTNTIAVTGNTIYQFSNLYGIFIGISEGPASLNATVTGNTVKEPGSFAINGIRVDAGATSGPPADNGALCITLTGNDTTGSAKSPPTDTDIRLRQRFSTTIKLPGYSGANNDTTAVNNFVAANNDPAGIILAPTVSSAQNVGGGGGGFTGGAACATPIAMAPATDLSLAQNHLETNLSANTQVASTDLNSANTYTAAFASWKLSEQASGNNLPNTVINASTGSGGKPLFTVQPVPAQSGETVSVPAFTLPAGKSVTIKFQVTANGPSLPLGTSQISNQATLSGSNFSNVLTDDPSVGGGSDPTITPVDRPDTTVTSINRAASSPTNTASVSWTVTFPDAVSGLSSNNFSLVNSGLGGTPAITAVIPVGSSPATQWTVTASTGTGDGTLGLNLTNDTTLSHDMTNLTFIGQVYTIERTPPTVAMSSAIPNPTNTSPISITVQFSETVNNFIVTDIVPGNATVDNFIAVDGDTYTFDLTPSGQGVVTADIAAGTATDTAGNSNTAATQFSRTFDSISPTVAMNSAASDPTNTNPIPVTVQFSETVSGFSATDIIAGNATVDNFVALDGDTYTFDLTPSGQGSVTADIPAGVATDGVGNDNTAATQFRRTFDSDAPTVAITSAASNPTNTTPIQVTVQFSENMVGFAAVDITPGNATIGNFVAVDGDTYMFDLTPSGQGVVTVDITAGVAQDGSGNDNSAASQFSRTFDSDVPTVTMTSAAPDPTNTSSIFVTAQFSENVTDFDASDIMAGNATVANFVAMDGDTYTFDLTPLGAGLVTADIAAGSAADIAGNGSSASAQFSRTFDSDTPTVTMSSTVSDPTNASPIPVTVQFSENVTGFDASDVTSSNSTVNNFAVVDSDTYTFNLVPSGQGQLTADIVAGVAQDSSSNGNSAAPQFSRTFDTLAPSLTINQASGQADPADASPINFTVVFSEPVSGFTSGDVSLSGTANPTTAVITGSGATYNVAVSGMTSSGTVVVSIPAGIAQDAATNLNTASTSIDNTISYIRDNTSPIVVSVLRADANPTSAVSLNFTVTFSEPVTGVDVNDFSLTASGLSNASVSAVNGSNDVYTVTVNTGSNNGSVRLNVINNGTIKDTALNSLGAEFSNGEIYTIINKSATFADVPSTYWANSFIERLYNANITSGCSVNPLIYCPDSKVTRAQMAVFILKSVHGSSYVPPNATGTVFEDVPITYWAAGWIEQFYAEGFTGGCGAGKYCPDAVLTTRAQMAIFLLRGKYGSNYVPPAPSGIFNDVPVTYWAAPWIEQLYAEGITSGCGNGNYCPEASLTRAEMAIFLVRAFTLP